ncbi:aldehyde dehydrogenase family protein [Microbacterium sp. LRZ72]|uniref:aldehyde dehydrogenase family protein n=1 Tax=Microbacterium sp. LRZ72 TaxID=2942481 RepID=UPI0029BABBC5|nr:aldehyde dehydrogenase family protein [Microbacterium sp. LRZ72]MDX2377410.1 aldehyde dehydrogenase family protein [Microbacterium sp. LRZ72]
MTLTVHPPGPHLHPDAAAFLDRGPRGLLIGGEWVRAASGATFATRDPATGEHLAEIARADTADVDAAVAAATEALTAPAWAEMTPAARGALLWRIADVIEEHADELAQLETLDQGKSWRTARFGEIPAAVNQFRYYSGWPTKILGETIPTSLSRTPPGKQVFAYTRREPVGVVAAIVPWNSPMLMASMKLAPALAAGCTLVLKPAEDTPLTALRLGELLGEAGLPAGVVNVVTGYGGEAGEALATHRDVAKVTFTGSTAVGKHIAAAAGADLRRVTLELGGKSPSIVMDDADIDQTIEAVSRGIFDNGGQVCVASSRIYAHRDVYERLVEGMAAFGSSLRLGHGLDPHADLGPLVSATQAERVDAFVAEGRAAGVDVVTGGRRDGPAGTFYSPTVLTGVREDMRLMREEIFGPVAAVTPFDDLDEVIGWANDTRYGLAASVFTQGLSNAHRIAGRLQSGTVWVNCHSFLGPELPKGGHKESGWGYENGAQGLENYLETKTVVAVI